jgi:hypothetical protein
MRKAQSVELVFQQTIVSSCLACLGLLRRCASPLGEFEQYRISYPKQMMSLISSSKGIHDHSVNPKHLGFFFFCFAVPFEGRTDVLFLLSVSGTSRRWRGSPVRVWYLEGLHNLE